MAPAPVDELRDPELELAIERDPSDESFAVYADWLQQRGNPRGELMALDLAGSPAAGALREQLAPQLLGPLAALGDQLDARWRAGFLEAICIETSRDEEDDGSDVVTRLRQALALPSARFLRELVIGLPSVHEELYLLPALIAAGPRPLLRKLALVTNVDEEMLSWTVIGNVGDFDRLFPNLEILEVFAGSLDVTAPHYPALRELSLRTCSMTRSSLAAIIAADWPKLEQLELWFGSESYQIDVPFSAVAPLLQSQRLPRLRSLALSNCEFTDELCAAILESPLLPKLTHLEFAQGTMTAVGAAHLIRRADRLRHLDAIVVDDNYLTDEDLAALQRALPQTRSENQREPDNYDGELRRYAAVGE